MSFSTPPAEPTHDEVAQCARELWTQSGCPAGHDEAIWYEAERRLQSARRSSAMLLIPPPLPVRRPRRTSRIHTPSPATGSQPHILVVDDPGCDGWTWAGALRRAGYRVALSADADAGWHALDSDEYTLLIFSQQNPDGAGVEFIRKVRAIPDELPSILMRAPTDENATDVSQLVTLDRPVSIPRLLAAVRTLLNEGAARLHGAVPTLVLSGPTRTAPVAGSQPGAVSDQPSGSASCHPPSCTV